MDDENKMVDDAVFQTEEQRQKEKELLDLKVRREQVLSEVGITQKMIDEMKHCPFCANKVYLIVNIGIDKETKAIKDAKFGFQCSCPECFFFLPPVIPRQLILSTLNKYNRRRASSSIIIAGKLPEAN